MPECFVTLGLLLGYSLATTWRDAWTPTVADLLSLSSSTAMFVVSSALLLGCAVLVGRFGPQAVDVQPPDLAGRLAGALLAALNLCFALAWLGSWANATVLSGDNGVRLRETRLLEGFALHPDETLLIATLLGGAMLAAAVVVQRRRHRRFRARGVPRPVDARVHRRDQAALAPETEKVEPDSRDIKERTLAFGGLGPSADATVPIPVVRDPTERGDRPAPSAAAPPGGQGEWLTLTPAGEDGGPMRCLRCGERLRDEDRFCPRCGRPLN
jgi:hypothetical protein